MTTMANSAGEVIPQAVERRGAGEPRRLAVFDPSGTRAGELVTILGFLGHGVEVIDSLASLERRLGEESAKWFTILVAADLEEADQERLVDRLAELAPELVPVVLCRPAVEGEPPVLLTYPKHWPLVTLPLDQESLEEALTKVQAGAGHRRHGKPSQRPPHLFRSLIGRSPAIQRIRDDIQRAAPTEANVLILGESGTGKEVVARNIHYYSKRRDKPFVPVNCGAIPRDLLESELFGHEKGAFTGALTAREGRFSLANGGTLFLDEIGEMPMEMQVKLLRVLEERTFERVGGNRTIHADVRIIAATNRNLEQMVSEGKFRQDLYYRLEVFPIELPPLRERIEDLPLLIAQLNERLEHEKGCSVQLAADAVRMLSAYAWPGNVRELANLMERLAIQYPNSVVHAADLPARYRTVEPVPELPAMEAEELLAEPEQRVAPAVTGQGLPRIPPGGLDLKSYIAEMEIALIRQALEEANGVVAHAAKLLGLRRTTLAEKMRKYGLTRPG